MRFTIPGKPFGKMRPRRGKFNVYDPKENREHEKFIRKCFIEQCGLLDEPYDCPIYITINSFYSIPKQTPKKKRELMLTGKMLPMIKPDIDNVAKSVLDALNGFFYTDDKQVIEISIRKFYSNDPRTEIMIGRYNNDVRTHI